jgi:hypothetical protein
LPVPHSPLEDLLAALEEAAPVSSAMDKRLAPWFEGRRWRVMDELSGTVTVGQVRIAYASGEFEIAPPGVFVTPLGHRGRRGIAIIETGEDGRDIPGTSVAFGEATLRRASSAYGTVSGLAGERQ